LVTKLSDIEGKIGWHAWKALRIERQHALQPEQRVEPQHADSAKEDHRDRVFVPFLLNIRLDAGEAVEGAFDRADNWGEERPAIVENVRHVSADGIGGGDGQCEREENFE
jgi:hypothetical protein